MKKTLDSFESSVLLKQIFFFCIFGGGVACRLFEETAEEGEGGEAEFLGDVED